MRKLALLTLAVSAAAALSAAAAPAAAHTGVSAGHGLAAGFGHPFAGADHVLAMIAVGILAFQLGGRALWQVPLAFVAAMIVGGLLADSGVGMPFAEQGILGSIVILGLVITAGRQMPARLAMAMAAAFAVFHGYAHGAEMPAAASGMPYGLGFVTATALLHAAGIVLGYGAAAVSRTRAPLLLRAGGAAVAMAGLALFVA